MPQKKTQTKKTKKDCPHHAEIIQDRIAGLRICELVTKYKMTPQNIHKILKANKEAIDKHREELLSNRQEAIDKALDDDVETLSKLVTETGEVMLLAIGKIKQELQDPAKDLKTVQVIMAVDACTKALDKVRAIVLAQQKEANR